MTYEQLVAQPLFFNPQLTRGVPRRATREEEAEVLRWARAGVSRVRHVLAAGGASREGCHARRAVAGTPRPAHEPAPRGPAAAAPGGHRAGAEPVGSEAG